MARKDLFSTNLEQILSLLKNKPYMTKEDLHSVFDASKSLRLIASSLSFSAFHNKLIKNGLLQDSVKIKDRVYVRYTMSQDINIQIYKFAATIEAKRRFFSMSTSLNVQGLSDFRQEIVFLTKERFNKNYYDNVELTQEKIDNAFSKPYRRTQAIGKFHGYNIALIEANRTGRNEFEVIEYNEFKVSSINRAFVEIISSVGYMKSATDIIKTFIPLKDKLDLDRVFKVIKKFDFVYPYYQLAGYYLERIGFSKTELKKFHKELSEFDFYTQKAQEHYEYDAYWKIYH